MSLDELVTAFTACTLPRAAWTHTAHLSVGAWAVERRAIGRRSCCSRPAPAPSGCRPISSRSSF